VSKVIDTLIAAADLLTRAREAAARHWNRIPITWLSVFFGFVLPAIVLAFPCLASIIRVNRAEMIEVLGSDYVLAARATGADAWRIVLRHMVPNCAAPYIVFATANLGYAVVVEAALSFLGVGTPPDVPSWGGMLSITGQKYVEVSPWLVVFPSIAVSLAVFGFNLLGDAIRDALDPRLKGAQE